MNLIKCKDFICLSILEKLAEKRYELDNDPKRIYAVKSIIEFTKDYFQILTNRTISETTREFQIKGVKRHLSWINEYIDTGDIQQKCSYMREEDFY